MQVKQSKWLIGRAAAQVNQKFWQAASEIPAEAWRRWAGTLAIGLGLCALMAFAITHWAMNSSALSEWDARVLPLITERFPMSFDKGVTWQSPGNLVGMVPVVVIFAALTSWFSRPLIAATAMMAYGLQFALVWIGWGLWSRDRPDVIADGLAAPGLHSFPSGHATVVTTVYGFLFYLWFRSSRSLLERLLVLAVALLWIGLISMSRLVLGAHWPSDVIAGLAIALPWLAVVIIALSRAEAYLWSKTDRE